MRIYETNEIMNTEQIETAVIRAFENAEFMYGGLDANSLQIIAEMEFRNDKGRNAIK